MKLIKDIVLKLDSNLYDVKMYILEDNKRVGIVTFLQNKDGLDNFIMFINEDYQRKGIGTQVVNQLLNEYKQIKGLVITEDGIKFCKKLGAKLYGKKTCYYLKQFTLKN